jgi:hypothetical protein
MKARCYNPNSKDWLRYGGRGIGICDRWINNFRAFWRDMGSTYQPGLQIDRIDNDGNYEPTNCRWATRKEQARNTRNNRIIQTPWGNIPIAQAAEIASIPSPTLEWRLRKNWPQNKLFVPSREKRKPWENKKPPL